MYRKNLPNPGIPFSEEDFINDFIVADSKNN